MRSAIGGKVSYSALSQLYRPADEVEMARAVRELAAQGLTERDIGQHLGLDPAAVRRLLQGREEMGT
ncbi:MAG: hypothetical protein ACREVO_08160 [Steroidobacteraceae bacterium]